MRDAGPYFRIEHRRTFLCYMLLPSKDGGSSPVAFRWSESIGQSRCFLSRLAELLIACLLKLLPIVANSEESCQRKPESVVWCPHTKFQSARLGLVFPKTESKVPP